MLIKKKLGVNKIRKKFGEHCVACKFRPSFDKIKGGIESVCVDYLVCILSNNKYNSFVMSTAYNACRYLKRNYYYEDAF